jgi:hypothetical protein
MSQSQKQNHELIDDSFYVIESRWKTWKSFDKEDKPLITSLTEEDCVRATRFYLKGCQEGWDNATITYDGTVGGKL